uniref:Glutathione peroxidase n=1 Tax=Panagrolaimus superbus TaxID=310955 RepID=A0A914YX31_9BILA
MNNGQQQQQQYPQQQQQQQPIRMQDQSSQQQGSNQMGMPSSSSSSQQQQESSNSSPGPALIDETSRWKKCDATNQSIYDFQIESLNGTFTDLSAYRGQVLLIVNVATFCAYTQQYTDFNPMLQQNSANGFKILAFPCNQFYLQEPAENHEIMNGLTYVRPGNGWKPHNDLHIFGKVEVNGENNHPLYEFLKESCPQTVDRIGKRSELMYDVIGKNDITWNFEKFLIDRQGRPRVRFHPTAWSHGQVIEPHMQELLAEQA